jgi:hypothetical protein
LSVNESLISATNQTIPSSVNEPMLTDWILVLVTIALVCVTIFYAYQTWRLVRVAYTPVLRAVLATSYSGPNYRLGIEVENIGVGTAVSIRGEYSINNGSKQNVVISLLRPDEKHRRIPLNELPDIENRSHYENIPTMIRIELKFKDIFDHNFTYKESLDVSDFAIHFQRNI